MFFCLILEFGWIDCENSHPIISSPGHRPCELLSWVSVRRLSVSFSHLNFLLWNRWTEISQTCQKCSLDGPLPDLCFWCWFEIQHGCQGPEFHIFIFFSETTKQIWIKLGRNVHWMVIYKIFVFGADWKSNMAARAHNVFWLVEI